jgi:hypothetical protein
MKKLLTIASVLFSTAMFAAGTGNNYSASLSGAAVVKTTASTFKLYYKSEVSTDVKVSIYNEAKSLVYFEKIKNTSGFIRPYSLENMEEGNFTVTIEDHAGTTVQKISTIPVDNSKLVNVLKLNNGEAKYLLTVGGKGEESILFNIYDGQHNLVHSEAKTVNGDFAQIYNLSKVKGTPSFEVLHQNGSLESIEY